MIRLKITDKRDIHGELTSWCAACVVHSGMPDEETCDVCKGFRETEYSCPDCGVEESFFGHDDVGTCTACGILLPDMGELLELKLFRVEYHTDD